MHHLIGILLNYFLVSTVSMFTIIEIIGSTKLESELKEKISDSIIFLYIVSTIIFLSWLFVKYPMNEEMDDLPEIAYASQNVEMTYNYIFNTYKRNDEHYIHVISNPDNIKQISNDDVIVGTHVIKSNDKDDLVELKVIKKDASEYKIQKEMALMHKKDTSIEKQTLFDIDADLKNTWVAKSVDDVKKTSGNQDLQYDMKSIHNMIDGEQDMKSTHNMIDSEQSISSKVYLWHAISGDTINNTLIDWANQSGWTVNFRTNKIYKIENSAYFNGDFESATTSLINSIDADSKPKIVFHSKNKVLTVDDIKIGE